MRCGPVLMVGGLALVVLIGCGRNDGVKVYPVKGQVLVRGEPAEGAHVVFYAITPELREAGVPPPEATTDARGEFRLRTFAADDGAPEGQFEVTVFWPEPIPPGADSEEYEPRDRLGGRYTNRQTSGLSATVERGGGTLPPFELE